MMESDKKNNRLEFWTIDKTEEWWPECGDGDIGNDVEQCNYDPAARYYDQGGLEVQDIIKAKLTPEQYEGFCLGNIIKYSCRANWKGQKKRDIEKVGFYQRFLDEAMEADK